MSGTTFQFTNTSANAHSYSWSFGSTQNSPQFTFTVSPPYTVTLTAVNNCSNSSVSKVVNVTGVENESDCENKMWYSNESAELIIRRCNSQEAIELVISDVSGERKAGLKNPGERTDLSNLKPGIYVAEIVGGGKRTAIKIIRQ